MIDSLGHPITEGCTVVTPGYWNPTMNVILKVGKVTSYYVHITMTCDVYDYKTRKTNLEVKTLRRRAHQVMVIDKQLKYNRKAYPEHQL